MYDYDLTKQTTVAELLKVYWETKMSLENHISQMKSLLDLAEQTGIRTPSYRLAGLQNDWLTQIKISTWQRIVDVSKIERVMSASRYEAFMRDLDNNNMNIPEPTAENITQLLAGASVAALAEDLIKEVFDFLRPGVQVQGHEYKTNSRPNAVQKKIILRYACDYYGFGSFRKAWLREHTRNRLVATDKLFHLLGKKEFPTNCHYSPLVDAIQSENGRGETEFFRWKRYSNGNLHLEIKEEKLLADLNRLGGQLAGNHLPEKP